VVPLQSGDYRENDMQFKMKTAIIFNILISLILIGTLAACGGSLFSYRGATVKAKNRISLEEGGLHEGRWQTRDLAIDYVYQVNDNNLEISGIVELAASLKTGFTTLNYLYLSLNLLDNEGKVIETKGIKSFGHQSWILTMAKMSFTRHLEPPEGTAAIAFSYKGRVSEGGTTPKGTGTGGDAIFWNFWLVPQR
jgi:hypothetical protein